MRKLFLCLLFVVFSAQAHAWQHTAITDAPFNATCDGVTDDGPAIRAAISATPNGGTLVIPCMALVNSCVNNAMLDFSGDKRITLQGTGYNVTTNGDITKPRGSGILGGPSIPPTCSYIRIAGVYSDSGPRFKDFVLLPKGGIPGTPVGLHGIFFDATGADGFQAGGILVDHVYIGTTAAGHSIHGTASNANAGGAFAYARITNSGVNSIYVENMGDGATIDHNQIADGAPGTTGIYFYNCSGCTNTVIDTNVISTNNGMITVDGANTPVIVNNEFESAASANSNGAFVRLRGAVSKVHGATLTGNRYSQNNTSGTINNVLIENASWTYIAGGSFHIQTPGYHVKMTAAATNTFIGPAGASVGATDSPLYYLDSGLYSSKQAVDQLCLAGDASGKTCLFATPAAKGTVYMPAPNGSATLVSQ